MKPYKSSGSPCGSNDRLPPIRANLFLLWISIVTSYFIPDIFNNNKHQSYYFLRLSFIFSGSRKALEICWKQSKISNVTIFAFIPWICTKISFLFALQNWALTMLVYVAIQLISTSVSCFHLGLKVHSIGPICPVKTYNIL